MVCFSTCVIGKGRRKALDAMCKLPGKKMKIIMSMLTSC